MAPTTPTPQREVGSDRSVEHDPKPVTHLPMPASEAPPRGGVFRSQYRSRHQYFDRNGHVTPDRPEQRIQPAEPGRGTDGVRMARHRELRHQLLVWFRGACLPHRQRQVAIEPAEPQAPLHVPDAIVPRNPVALEADDRVAPRIQEAQSPEVAVTQRDSRVH